MPVTSEQLALLKQEMPYKMRQGPKGTQLAYIDARQVMDLLDEVCGPENWSCQYQQIKDVVYCGLSINTVDSGWVCKWDAGDESNIDAQKGEASDSFKRAAVRWGVGRFLYGLGQKKPTYTTPAAKPAPTPAKPATTEADPREAIKARCEELGISGKDLTTRLKELGFAWKTLTAEQGKTVLAKLG